MPRLGMLIDLRTCIGCHACSVACKAEFDVPLGVFRDTVKYVEVRTPGPRGTFCPFCAISAKTRPVSRPARRAPSSGWKTARW